jgi:hypothetical protein
MTVTAFRNRSDGLENFGGPLPEAPRRYAAGRVCACPGCGTVLNPYNKMDVCYRHDWYKSRPPRLAQHGQAIDSTACRAHLLRLNADGLVWSEICKRCGVDQSTVKKIADGKQQRVRESTAESLLSVGVTS